MKKNSGQTVLLLVVLIVVLLGIFFIRGQKIVEIEQSVVERSRLDKTAENAFQNTTQKAIWLLENDSRLEAEDLERNPDYKAFDSLFDNWSLKGPENPHIDHWTEQDPELRHLENNIVVRWRLTDVHSFFNINSLLSGTTVSEESRKRFTLFLEELKVPEPEQLTNSLADWLDGPPPEDGTQVSTFDSNLYEKNAKNGPLLTLSELQMIPGFSKDILEGNTPELPIGLYSCLTVAPTPNLNANTAPAHVILLSHEKMTASMANRIAGGRSDSPYETIDEVVKTAAAPEDLPISSLFNVKSEYFFLEMEAHYLGIRQKKRVLIRRQGSTASVEIVENMGVFTWDADLRKKMDAAVEKRIESLQD
jgi:type II secretory pathway component PulK